MPHRDHSQVSLLASHMVTELIIVSTEDLTHMIFAVCQQ